jgi:hypothetical protein
MEYGVRGGNALQHWTAHVELNHLVPTLSEDNASREASLVRAAATYERLYSLKKRVQVRLFGGRFLQKSTTTEFVMGLSGSPDYRRQTAFLDRQQISDALTAQVHQTDGRDGAFKAYVPAQSQRWLSTLNLQADLPVTPLGIFADFGATKEKQIIVPGRAGQRLFYDAGLVLPIGKDILQFYFPVAGSQYQNGFPSSRQNFTNNIRFLLRLDQLNPFKLLDESLAQ